MALTRFIARALGLTAGLGIGDHVLHRQHPMSWGWVALLALLSFTLYYMTMGDDD
jgi:hypothetical protein